MDRDKSELWSIGEVVCTGAALISVSLVAGSATQDRYVQGQIDDQRAPLVLRYGDEWRRGLTLENLQVYIDNEPRAGADKKRFIEESISKSPEATTLQDLSSELTMAKVKLGGSIAAVVGFTLGTLGLRARRVRIDPQGLLKGALYDLLG